MQHVEFARRAENARHLPQPPLQLPDSSRLESKQWQQLAKPPRGHSQPVQRCRVAIVKRVSGVREPANRAANRTGPSNLAWCPFQGAVIVTNR